MYFSNRIKKRNTAELISIGAMASRGDPKDLKKQLADLEKD
jgi:hypothetical protein